MNDVDEILAGYNKESNKESFDREAWAKKKQEDRKKCYDLMYKTADEIKNSPEKFKSYLDIQGKFDKYSVGNALLITSQMPNATQLKEFNDWKDLGAYIKKGQEGITILEPGDSYTRADGSTAPSYNPKKMFDVSQTTFKAKERKNNYDDVTKLTALLKDCPVDIKALENPTETDKVAMWNKEDSVLYVKIGGEPQVVFRALSMELARASLEETGNSELDDFKCKCTSYMLCKKYGIDVSNYDFNSLPEALKEMNSGEVRNELSSMRGTMEDINSRMSQYFENVSKTHKSKEQER